MGRHLSAAGDAQFVRTEKLCGPEVGRKLKGLREATGLSAAEVAVRSRLTKTELRRLETSPGENDLSTLMTVCRVLGVGLEDLADQEALFVERDGILPPGKGVESPRRRRAE